jgi:hypothetical protein
MLTGNSYYRSLHPRTRMLLGAGVVLYGVAGLAISDWVEKRFGFEPTEEEKKKLQEVVPRVRTVERRE